LRHLFRCFDAERQDIALEDPVIGGFVHGVARSAESQPVLIFGNTLSHLAPIFHRVLGDRLRLLHLHRDPVVNSASIYVKTRPELWRLGRFEDDPYGLRISAFDPHARFIEYRDRWPSLSAFEVILYQWLERHAYAVEAAVRMPEIPFLSLRSEDLFDDPHRVIEQLAGFVGLDPPGPTALRKARRNQTWTRILERRPMGDRWRVFAVHSALLELARELGHPMDPHALEREMARYQLPPGILPWLRHHTRYWEWRSRTADWLRARGVVPAAADETGGLPPRPLVEALREVVLRRRV
jgi:hypothetical protein